MSIPHQFPSLVEGPNQVVLITGTGLSTPNCPMLKELKPKIDKVATYLEVDRKDDEYELAEAILNKLLASGKSDPESRLWFAEQLGMLDDRCWFGEIGLPLSGNTPRHRALARFVVEERLGAVVNLNWDALLEVALDSVGLSETENLQRPWKITKYARVVDKKHMPLLAQANVFPVIKPHGCVRDLEHLRRRFRSGEVLDSITFKLTTTEMSKLTQDQENAVNVKVKDSIANFPLIGIGWRASEDYLRNSIIDIAQQVNRPEPDPFTLIDIEWNENHLNIATAYNKSKDETFAQVSTETSRSTDNLMQWLQARHAIKRIIAMTPTTEQAPLEKLLQELDQSDCGHPVQQWADFWLPTWVRVCWRAGAMKSYHPQTGKLIGPHEIPIVPRDVHIPLTGMAMERRDLHAASKLLCALSDFIGQFRFDLYPGGLFDMENNHLYLPLPGWKENVPPSDLAALKPFVEALKNLGYVKKIFLLLLNNKDEQQDVLLRKQLETQFRRLMPLAAFASEEAVSWINLEELKGN